MLNRAQLEPLLAAAQQDPQELIQRCFSIQTKGLPGQALVDRLRFNTAQLKIHDALMAQRRAGRPPRAIVLKARQPGASSLCAAYAAAMMVSRPYAQSLIVAHVDSAALKLLQKVKFMLENMPEELRPFIRSDRREELTLWGLPCSDGDGRNREIQLRTGCYIGTATGQEIWRGMTIQCAHLSEASAYPRAEETFLGVMQAVPSTPQSLVVVESTARGMGNLFHEEWQRAEAGESEFVPVFIGWWEIDENRMVVPKDFQLEPEERELKRAFGLANEQLQWRRYAIHTSCGGDVDLFDQEHPSSSSVAFTVSGRPAFPVPILREMHEQAEKLVPLRAAEGTFPAQGVIDVEGQFHRLARGPFTIYRPPHPDHEYVVSADVAAGVEGGDYSCAQVFDRTTEEQVAIWHGHMTPVQFALVCAGIGMLYHKAIMVPEVTGGWGYTVVEELKRLQYPRLYIWVRHDKVRNMVTNFYGWETSARTRPLLINSLANALLERSIRILDPATIVELMEFQYVDGTRRAEGLKHDDRSIALMIAYRVHL